MGYVLAPDWFETYRSLEGEAGKQKQKGSLKVTKN